jgi:predicted transcriptional regulator
VATVARRAFGRDGSKCFVVDCYITQYRPIEQHVKQTETVMKRNQEASAAWKDYQETGLHAILDELDAWLATWGAPDLLPMREHDVSDQSGYTLLGLRGTGRGMFRANVGRAISDLRDEWE